MGPLTVRMPSNPGHVPERGEKRVSVSGVRRDHHRVGASGKNGRRRALVLTLRAGQADPPKARLEGIDPAERGRYPACARARNEMSVAGITGVGRSTWGGGRGRRGRGGGGART